MGSFWSASQHIGAQRKCIKLCQPYRYPCGGNGCDDGIDVSHVTHNIRSLLQEPLDIMKQMPKFYGLSLPGRLQYILSIA